MRQLNKAGIALVAGLAGIGDLVRIQECRPYSKEKRWRLLEIVERAK